MDNSSFFSFEKLNVWQRAREVMKITYSAVKSFPPYETFGLADQMRRSAVSIVSNIAEGTGRDSDKQKKHFFQIARGSAYELYCQYVAASDLEYINKEKFDEVKESLDVISRMLYRLIASTH